MPIRCSAIFAAALICAFGVRAAETNSLLSEANPELLARAACSTCHLFPAPTLLDKTIWPAHIFPKMRLYMGLDKVDTSKSKDGQILAQEHFFPAAPLIPEASWQRITN